MVSHILFLNLIWNFIFIFINQWIEKHTGRRVESIGNGRDETETDSSSNTFAWDKVAVVFTGRTIPRLNGSERRNNNLVDRGEELCERCTCALCCCPFTSSNGLSNKRAPVSSSFTTLFFRFLSIFRLGRPFSPIHVSIVVGSRVSRGCNSTRCVTLSIINQPSNPTMRQHSKSVDSL